MCVLVTGGAGYIGSHTVRLLRERGEHVIVLDNMQSGHRAAIGDTPLIEGDIADEILLKHLFAAHTVEAVIHFAANKAAGESMQKVSTYFHNNVSGTLSLLRAMHQAGVLSFVFSSTCAVYGTPTELPVGEEHEVHPENPYGASKLIAEQMLKWFDRCHDLRYVSLRYFNAAGAALDGCNGECSPVPLNLIPLVMKAALGSTPRLTIFGTDYPTPDGTTIRDYIHVLDLAAGHVQALDYLRAHGPSDVINLGTGTGSSVQQVIDLAQRITGITIPVEYAARRPGDAAAIWAKITKARQVLGWEPQYGLEDIIYTAWQWHSTHVDGFA